MAYSYERVKPYLFTDDGQRDFLKVRDRAAALLKEAGAFRAIEAWSTLGTYSTDDAMACLDRLVELKEIAQCSNPVSNWGQHQVFVKGTFEP